MTRTRRNRCAALLTALLAIGALSAGCGGGKESSATPALGRADFTTRANAICEQADKQIEAAARRYLGPGKPTPREFEEFASEAVVPHTEEIVDGIARLSPPASLADAVERMLAEARLVADRLAADPALLAGSADPFAEVNRLAGAAGLDSCAGD